MVCDRDNRNRAAAAAAGPRSADLDLELAVDRLVERHLDRSLDGAARADRGHQIIDADYGTGYASRGYLSSFPFDIVKLDRTLIQGIGQDSKDDIIISSTIEMSHALGLTVVAEGIETIQQADQVTAFGCDLGQGYYYAAPKPAAQLQLPTQRSPHRPAAPAIH